MEPVANNIEQSPRGSYPLLPHVDNAAAVAVKQAILSYYTQYAHQVHACLVVTSFYVATSLATTLMWGALFAILLNLALHFIRLCIMLTGVEDKVRAIIEPIYPVTVSHSETQEESLVLDPKKMHGQGFVTRYIHQAWWGLYFSSQYLRSYVTGGKVPRTTYPQLHFSGDHHPIYSQEMTPKKTM
jgi:hypothetical protein